MIKPEFFTFDHDGIETESYVIRVKDLAGNTLVGAQIGLSGVESDGIHRKVNVATHALRNGVPLNTDVKFTVTASNSAGAASAEIPSPVFQFKDVLNDPFNLAVL